MCSKEFCKKIEVIDIKKTDYKKAWELQKKIHEKRVKGEVCDTLILVEHEHVITFGKSAKRENLLFDENFLKKKGIKVYKIERGGDVTYHGPGQLVGYPIFKIKGLTKIKKFVENIEKSIIHALAGFGINAEKNDRFPGVWIGNEKICAIGIAVKNGVSFHGFALNVNTDLSYFNFIIPCGIKDKGVTSMQKILERKIEFEKVKKKIAESFAKIFERELIWKKF